MEDKKSSSSSSTSSPSSHGMTVEKVGGDSLTKIQSHFLSYGPGAIRVGPGRCFMPATFADGISFCRDFETKPSDVWIVTYPKCGTTWTQELVWTMRNNPGLDNPMADVGINFRAPFLEVDFLNDFDTWLPFLGAGSPLAKDFLRACPQGDVTKPFYAQVAQGSPEPRTIKTHLPFSLLHPNLLDKVKVVYVARNPKDVCVSYLHHHRVFVDTAYTGSTAEFVQYYVDGDLMYGGYDQHLQEAWQLRNHPNFYFVFFEQMKRNPKQEIERLNTFLGTGLTGQQMDNILEYTCFEEMKSRDAVMTSSGQASFFVEDVVQRDGGFFRKGEVGSYKSKLSSEDEQKLDQWIEEKLTKMGIPFIYER